MSREDESLFSKAGGRENNMEQDWMWKVQKKSTLIFQQLIEELKLW